MAHLKKILITTVIVASVVGGFFALLRDNASGLGVLTNPGPLSQEHAHLAGDCMSCHTTGRGVEDVNCIACHANAKGILQRQPTAFHANIGHCADCHQEHRHPPARLSEMDHVRLAEIGLEQLEEHGAGSEAAMALARVEQWIANGTATAALPPGHVELTEVERSLNCAACHGNDDRHFDLFGKDCAACHGTDKWTIASFQHPSPMSRDCALCHQAPPSHYMMHFKMISAKVAGKPHAKVSECYECHQTTAWPDILGKGWYKHH